MKHIYFNLLILLFLGISSIFAQNTNRTTVEENLFEERRKVSDASPPKNAGATPNPGSIWVNRNEIINGRDVNTFSPEELISDILLGQNNSCGTSGMIRNVTFKGAGRTSDDKSWDHEYNRGLSYFSHGELDRDTIIGAYIIPWSLGMESGLLLTTSGGRDVEGPNSATDGLGGSGYSMSSDNDMVSLNPNVSYGALLEFDFVPLQSEISFDYIFASEEYPQYANSTFNDVFGFFISGPGIPGGKQNIALLPTTTTGSDVVSINNVNWGESNINQPSTFSGCPENCIGAKNPMYYVPNYNAGNYQGKYMEYNARTVVLTARATVIPGQEYHLKLGVSNITDASFGSGVFLRAGSLDLGTGISNSMDGGSMQMNNIFEGCQTYELEINFLPSAGDMAINLEYSGDAANDICQLDGSPMPTSVTAPANTSSYPIPYKVKSPVSDNNEEIQIIATTILSAGCEQTDTVNLRMYRKFSMEIQTTLACNGDIGTISAYNIEGGSPYIKMSIDDGVTWEYVSHTFTGLSAGDYTVMAMDSVGCDTLFIPVTIYANPVLSNTSLTVSDICGEGAATFTATCEIPNVDFSWTRAEIPGIEPLTGSAAGPTINETLTNTTDVPITVTYVFTLLADGCMNTQEVKVIVNPSFLLDLNASPPEGLMQLFGETYICGDINTVTNGVLRTISATTQPCYKFVKWTTLSGDSISSDNPLNVTVFGDTTFVADLEISNYHVNLSSDDITHGSASFEDSIVECGTTIQIMAIPELFHEFDYWTENGKRVPNLGQTGNLIIDRDRTLVAVFKPETYDIYVKADPIEAGEVEGGGIRIEYDSLVTVEVTYTNPLYECEYWSFNDVWQQVYDGTPYTFRARESGTVTAHFTKKTYTVLVSPEQPRGKVYCAFSGETLTDNELNDVEYGQMIDVLAVPDTNYRFVEWRENDVKIENAAAFYSFPVNGDHHLKAHFAPVAYDITVEPSPQDGGIVEIIGTEPFEFLDSIAVKATAHSTHAFSHWSNNDNPNVSNNAEYWFSVTGDQHFTAHFLPKLYDITLSKVPIQGGTVKGDTTNIPYGQLHTIEAIPATNYTFLYWTEGTDTIRQAEYIFNVLGSRHLTAHFAFEIHNIVVQASPQIAGTVSNDTVVSYGELLTVEVLDINDEFFAFSHWTSTKYPDINYPTLSHTFTVTGVDTLTAHFDSEIFNINLSKNIEEGGEVCCSGSYPYGFEIPITTKTNPGFTFLHWMEADTVFTTEPDFTLLVLGERDFTAYFEDELYDITLIAEPDTAGSFISSIEPSTGISYNASITIQALEEIGYIFQYWTVGNDTIEDNPYTFNVTHSDTLIAHYEYKEYLIELFAESGGNVEGSGTYPHNYELTVKAIPNLLNKFSYWEEYLENDTIQLDAPEEHTFNVTEERTLIAYFEEKLYTITTTAGPTPGGTTTVVNSPDITFETDIPYNEIRSVLAVPADNYNFKYWKEGNQTFPDSLYTFPVIKDRDLEAVFELKTFTINVNWEPSGGGTATGSGTFPHGEACILTATPLSNYDFIEWRENDEVVCDTREYPFLVDRNRNLIAYFELKNFNITTKVNPSGSGTTSGDGFNLPYGTDTAVYAHPKPNYMFVNWTEDGVPQWPLDTIYEITVTRSRELTANFKLVEFNIIVEAEPPHAGWVSDNIMNLPFGADTAVTAKEHPFYTFVEWRKDGKRVSGDRRYPFSATESCTYVAHFTSDKFTINLHAEPSIGGEVSGGGTVAYGDSVTVNADPNLGYIFVKWMEGDEVVSEDASYGFRVTGNRELTAIFEPAHFNVTVYPNPEKGGSALGSESNIPAQREVTVTAIHNEFYEFVNWTENGDIVSSDAEYTFKINDNRILIANFKTDKLHVTVEVNDTIYGNAYGEGYYDANALAQVRAVPKEGFSFSHWSIDEHIISRNTVYEFTVTADITLVAHFYALDFDTYAATMWSNTFMLNLNLLKEEEYDVVGCKWLKNNIIETKTNALDDFSYSAGPKQTDKLEPDPTFYMFRLELKDGKFLYSTKKVIPPSEIQEIPVENGLLIYPNPAYSGNFFTIEGTVEGCLVYVYNQFGLCIGTHVATSDKTSLALDLPAGIYLIRSEDKTGKVLIIK